MTTVKTWRDFTDAELGPDLAALRSQRFDLVKRANIMLAKATAEQRDLTPDESREAESLMDEVKVLEHRLGNASMRDAQRRVGIDDYANGNRGKPLSQRAEERAFLPGEFRALAKNESFYDHLVGTGEIVERRGRPLSLGKTIRGIVTGQWQGAEDERRALSGSNDTAGGYTLSEELSSLWIDRARSKSVMVSAGVRTVPMKTASLSMARVTGDPTPAWRIEGDVVASSEPIFGGVTFNARSLAVAIPVSKELLADAANAASIIESVLVSAMALELDRAILDGDGVRKPLGIRKASGVGTLAVGGAANMMKFAEAVGVVRQQNEEPTGLILHPRTYSAAIDRDLDTTNQPRLAPPSLRDLPTFQTTSVPATLGGGTETVAYVGDFSQVVVGMRQGIEIQIATQASDASGRGFERNEAIILATLRADSMLIREKAFCVLTGITN